MPKLEGLSEPSWEQQIGESDAEFDSFLKYRDLGRKRNFMTVAVAEGFPRGFVSISRDMMWVERARAWDKYLQTIRDSVFMRKARKEAVDDARKWERRKKDACENYFQESELIRKKANAMFQAPLYEVELETLADGTIVKTLRPKWSFKDAVQLMKLSAELQAASMAAATRDVEAYSEAELKAIANPQINLDLEDEDDEEMVSHSVEIGADDGPEISELDPGENCREVVRFETSEPASGEGDPCSDDGNGDGRSDLETLQEQPPGTGD